MKTLEVEDIYPAGYKIFADVAERLPRFIEEGYNAKRLHSAIGYRSLEEFETQLAQQAAQFEAPRWSSPRGSLHYRVRSQWQSTLSELSSVLPRISNNLVRARESVCGDGGLEQIERSATLCRVSG